MRAHRLRFEDHPDLSVFLVHFVSRNGRVNSALPDEIREQQAHERLISILRDGCIQAFPVWGAGNSPVVCFTECTKPGIESLLQRGRYEAFGIAFRKDLVFDAGGGPAFYVRGDEWKAWLDLPDSIRARATRLWPGATADDGEPDLATYLRSKSEWTVEREWRVIGTGNPPGFRFKSGDVAFVLLDDPAGGFPEQWLEDEEGLGRELERIPRLELDSGSNTIEDPAGIWLIHQRLPDALSARRVVRLTSEATRYWRFVRAALGREGKSREVLEAAAARSEERLTRITSDIRRYGGGAIEELRRLALDRAACGCPSALECRHLAELIRVALNE